MTWIVTVFLMAFIPGLALAQPAKPDTLDNAIKILQSFRDRSGVATLQESCDTVRREMRAGDAPRWSNLLGIVNDPRVPIRARLAVTELLLDKADARLAADLLDTALVWGEAARHPDDALDVAGNAPLREAGQLLSSFVSRMPNEPWRSWVGGSPKTLVLLSDIASSRIHVEPRAWNAVLEALALSPAPAKELSEAAEKIVTASQREIFIDTRILRLLDPKSSPKFRALIAVPFTATRDFHVGAASALAHVGDQPSLELLQNARQSLNGPAYAHAGSGAPQMAAYLDAYILRIELQHPPDRLLTFIGSDERPLDTTTRTWAMERALELGLGKPPIRTAVLDFKANLDRLQRDGKLPGDASRTPVSIGLVKQAALRLGILEATDLPDVKMPSEALSKKHSVK